MKGVDIKIARIKAGLKQYEVAARVGVTQTVISQIELGKREASPDMLDRIFSVLNKDSRTLDTIYFSKKV